MAKEGKTVSARGRDGLPAQSPLASGTLPPGLAVTLNLLRQAQKLPMVFGQPLEMRRYCHNDFL
jgi:hypothetical protein